MADLRFGTRGRFWLGAGLAERWRGGVRVQIWNSGAAAGREGVKRAGFRWKEAPATAALGGDARGAVVEIWRAVVRSSRPAFGSKVGGAARVALGGDGDGVGEPRSSKEAR
ncbi:putative proline-rich receptor-like protein kinase PERK3 [Iris pallida]|uniref:Proline-rich receptor-like protein kinase PERK3 n=1 Tax=Iris pallida TaxID=29817 RepID=A0AAX6FUT2_IRIPA|nr:putative proline-rich receptor-like protein kinase PERK3 [Iris pallida]